MLSDPPDDRTLRATGSPDWSDLAGARLTARGEEVVIEVTLAATPPDTANGDETFNVASFHDLDGDGGIDVEVWANLGPSGWGTAVYDNRTGGGSFDQAADARVVDGRLVVTFPWGLLDDARRWRFALASEYGTPAELGTRLAARDDLPDDDRPAPVTPS